MGPAKILLLVAALSLVGLSTAGRTTIKSLHGAWVGTCEQSAVASGCLPHGALITIPYRIKFGGNYWNWTEGAAALKFADKHFKLPAFTVPNSPIAAFSPKGQNSLCINVSNVIDNVAYPGFATVSVTFASLSSGGAEYYTESGFINLKTGASETKYGCPYEGHPVTCDPSIQRFMYRCTATRGS